ncbi:Dak1 domain-containing protein [Phascolomyces articulosus]|uniref:Dak1 domain-containing protein n=1 Tax=Phascolomyces articulosus TaxID=60185 RepID=A0AAD5KC56_9FUNG|nr:Dak1 domain-containing protein [Phascolomyces articulosus]
MTKHIVNDPENLVSESIQGLCYANPHLRWISSERIVCRADVETVAQNQVTLIAGGGSGHEPGFAGYVGEGMLTAAVCGHVFASPSSSQILAAIERVQSPHGTLVIVLNYTGDCLNFGLAVERAKARGILVDMVIVSDDAAIGNKSRVGRRGLAATIAAAKVAGAKAAQKGSTLEQVQQAAEYINTNSATLGVALDHCHVPGSATVQKLPEDQIELGMGIHNEPGISKLSPLPAKKLVSKMIAMLTDQKDQERTYLKLNQNSPVLLLVNNLGGISTLELNLVVKEAVQAVIQRDLEIKRVLSGTFLSSLNMPGVSITLIRLQDNQEQQKQLLDLIDYNVIVPGWPRTSSAFLPFTTDIAMTIADDTSSNKKQTITNDENDQQVNPRVLENAIREAAKNVIEAEPEVTSFDTVLGDGDCGITLKSAATAIIEALPELPLASGPRTMLALADIIECTVGGTSSAIYCIFLNALGAGLSKYGSSNVTEWAKASAHALNALQSYTSARVGDRTLMDSLIPFVQVLGNTNNMEEATKTGRQGAESTRTLEAHMGRASYISTEDVKQAALPDAGAWGLAALLEGLNSGLKK